MGIVAHAPNRPLFSLHCAPMLVRLWSEKSAAQRSATAPPIPTPAPMPAVAPILRLFAEDKLVDLASADVCLAADVASIRFY